jgi:flagellar protein FlaF
VGDNTEVVSMGFSVSGTAAIIFASMFVAFGVWFTASANSFDRVSDAQDQQTESLIDSENTEIEIASATYNESGNELLRIDATNTGASQLSLSETDLLIDGEFIDGWQENWSVNVEGNATTDLWLSGEQLSITRDLATPPTRVKIVTEYGVAETATVEVFV